MPPAAPRPYVSLCQRQTFGHPDSDTFRLLGFAFQIQVKQQTFSRLFSHHICQKVGKHVVKADLVLRDD